MYMRTYLVTQTHKTRAHTTTKATTAVKFAIGKQRRRRHNTIHNFREDAAGRCSEQPFPPRSPPAPRCQHPDVSPTTVTMPTQSSITSITVSFFFQSTRQTLQYIIFTLEQKIKKKKSKKENNPLPRNKRKGDVSRGNKRKQNGKTRNHRPKRQNKTNLRKKI